MAVLASVIHAIANGEEIGWRGYALPHLQARHSALRASLILGVIWAAFHIPILFTSGAVGGSQSFATALPFLVGILAMSVVVTWIFNNTRGSVLPIILLHGAMNTWPDLFAPIGGSPALAWVGTALMVLLATAVVLVFGPARLSRKPASELPISPDTATLART
jgi:membrane protease YdiL (CAAX protease family)